MIVYATLSQFRTHLSIPAADTSDDARLLLALRQATAQIDRYTTRRFAPVMQTRRFDYQMAYSLRLDLDLLELTGITNGDGSSLSPDDVRLAPTGDAAKSLILIQPDANALFTFDTAPELAIQVTGIWGWHDAWSQAWRASGDTVQDASLDADDRTISVTDADGADALDLTPRFQVGQLLRIGEEYLHVTGVDTSADTITVVRGVRGTTATSHAQDTPIAVYVPPCDVQALCLRWATWLYQQVNAGIGGGADWLYPDDLPADIKRLSAGLRRLRVA
ncbi:MAG: hypothetical protein JW910_02415 [Anaerolineae bacterium]|nr:hypothetical protein [Anaerolineae bacterium]